MSDGTKIEWTDATWNPVTGCSVVSPGCTNCYAMRLAGTRMRHHPSRQGLTVPSKNPAKVGRDGAAIKTRPVWNGTVRFNEDWLDQPLRWKRPRRIFVCAHGDLFHEAVPDEWIDQVFAVIAAAPQHVFQVLTKRPERAWEYAHSATGCGEHWLANCERSFAPMWPLPNVWLGVSVEDQARADERIPLLLDTPAAVRWLSMEPLLGPVDLRAVPYPAGWPRCDCLDAGPRYDALQRSVYCDGCCEGPERIDAPGIDWIIVGGESGPGARPMHPAWARAIRDQCEDAGVPFFCKQLSIPGSTKALKDIEQFPADLRVREFPA